eukprot:381233_1
MSNKKRKREDTSSFESSTEPATKKLKIQTKPEAEKAVIYIITIDRNANTYDERERGGESEIVAVYTSRKEANKHAKDLYKKETNGDLNAEASMNNYLFERYDVSHDDVYGDHPVHVRVHNKHTILTKYNTK